MSRETDVFPSSASSVWLCLPSGEINLLERASDGPSLRNESRLLTQPNGNPRIRKMTRCDLRPTMVKPRAFRKCNLDETRLSLCRVWQSTR